MPRRFTEWFLEVTPVCSWCPVHGELLILTAKRTAPLWDPRTNQMEETNNRALQLLDQLMDRPGVETDAFKRVVDICDEEGEYHEETIPRR